MANDYAKFRRQNPSRAKFAKNSVPKTLRGQTITKNFIVGTILGQNLSKISSRDTSMAKLRQNFVDEAFITISPKKTGSNHETGDVQRQLRSYSLERKVKNLIPAAG